MTTYPPSTPCRTSSPYDPWPIGSRRPSGSVPDAAVPAALAFWEQLRGNLAACPPPAADAEFVGLLGKLGVTAGSPLTAEAGVVAALTAGEAQGRAMVDKLAGGSADQEQWSTAKHMFDYNLDRLGLGTIDSPEGKIADRTKASGTR